jgi:PAS domain S-box-containing protein
MTRIPSSNLLGGLLLLLLAHALILLSWAQLAMAAWITPLGVMLATIAAALLVRHRGQPGPMAGLHPNQKLLYLNDLLMEANQQLQASEYRFRMLMEAMPQIVWTADGTGAVNYFSQPWYDYTGLSQAQSMGLAAVEAVHPEDRDRTLQRWQQALSTGDIFSIEHRVRCQDGTYRWFINRGIPLLEGTGTAVGWIGTLTDTDEQKRYQDSLRQSEARAQAQAQELEAFMEAVPVGVWIAHDPQCHKVTANRTAHRLMRRSEGAIMTATPGDQSYPFPFQIQSRGQPVPPEDLLMQRVGRTGRAETGQYEFVFENGDICYLWGKAVPLRDEAGNVSGVIGAFLDVTEQQQIEAALRRSEARSHQLVASNLIGIVFSDAEGNFIEANQTFLQMLGCTPAELTQLNWRAITPAEYLPLDQQATAELEAHGVCTPFEKEYVRKDGSRVPILLGATRLEGPEKEGACFVLDLTQQKQQAEALRQSEAMFRTLTNTMPQMVWVGRPSEPQSLGQYEYINQRCADYLGKTLEEVQGNGWMDCIHPEDRAQVGLAWQQSLDSGAGFTLEFRLQRAIDGAYRWHLGQALPIRDQAGEIIKWFGTCTDIHDQKLAIEDRVQLLERERAARLALERASRTKDEFLAIVSHELRSPLNGILGWARLLQSRQLSPDVIEKALSSIERNAQAQTQLIEDLLDISRIIRGQIRLTLRPTRLTPIIEAALDTIGPAASSKAIQITTQYDPAADCISADPDRLQQIIWNLLSNAVKFTPEGGQVTVSLERLEQGGSLGEDPVFSSPRSAYAQITVTDTGQGIDPSFLPYVFERFRQADATTARSQGGLGLGLAIVRNLAELHGGSVSVSSDGMGQGATFSVRLPLVTVEVGPQGRDQLMVPRQVRREVPFSLEGLKVLAVEDEADAQEFLQIFLAQYGVGVTVTSSACEALQLVPQLQPDVLLSDIGMPGEDGYSLIQKVRSLPLEQGGKVPAVALTGYARESDRIQALESGFDVHVPKPIEPIQLLTVLARLAGRSF